MTIDPIQVRKVLHSIPEMAFEEFQTKAMLLTYLSDIPGITIHQFNTNTGILVEYSHGEGDYRLFRADMDALPIDEQTGCDFSSGTPGMMHACGHDVHMAVLLGLIVRVTGHQIKRNLLFLFQPAEEGKGGAEAVLKDGLIQKFPIQRAYALHVSGKLPVGTVSSKAGIFFAIPQEFDIHFTGRAAHAAFPGDGRNALDAGVQFYQDMQKLAAELSRSDRLIFHVGRMESGTIRNIIPAKCILEGTHRTLSREMNVQINTAIEASAQKAAQAHRVDYKVDFLCSYDAVVNNPELYELFVAASQKLNLDVVESGIFMTGEDFGFFTTQYPGLLFWLGASSSSQDLHSDTFLPDENCIKIGIDLFERLALD